MKAVEAQGYNKEKALEATGLDENLNLIIDHNVFQLNLSISVLFQRESYPGQ